MALLRRNKVDQATIPTELQNYYQAEKRERTGVAWLLALGTLLLTILVILGLFFGGRWLYRKAHHKSQTTGTQQIKSQSENSENKDNESSEDESTSSSSSSNGSSSSTSSSSSSTSTPQTSSTNTSSTPASSSTTAATSNTSGLPNTGPGDTLAVFAAVSLLAYLVHRRFLAD